MSDEQIKQRIAYLVEHGGLYDDPLADLRRGVRVALALAGASAAFTLVDIMIDLL
jgi:hypothetical protein